MRNKSVKIIVWAIALFLFSLENFANANNLVLKEKSNSEIKNIIDELKPKSGTKLKHLKSQVYVFYIVLENDPVKLPELINELIKKDKKYSKRFVSLIKLRKELKKLEKKIHLQDYHLIDLHKKKKLTRYDLCLIYYKYEKYVKLLDDILNETDFSKPNLKKIKKEDKIYISVLRGWAEKIYSDAGIWQDWDIDEIINIIKIIEKNRNNNDNKYADKLERQKQYKEGIKWLSKTFNSRGQSPVNFLETDIWGDWDF
jgi:hypothetical protein